MHPTTLVLVRHAETEANIDAIWHGALDSPLTARGRMQVAATAARFATLAPELGGIDAFYVSPLQRAQTTADAIGDAIAMPPVIDQGLREFDLGDWEGRAMAELASTERLWEIWAGDADFAPPNGESPAAFGRRAVDATRRIAAAHPGQTVLLVTHGGFICHVLAHWLGSGLDDWQKWEPHNCSITILRGSDDAWVSVEFNNTDHLPPTAIRLHDTSAYSQKKQSQA